MTKEIGIIVLTILMVGMQIAYAVTGPNSIEQSIQSAALKAHGEQNGYVTVVDPMAPLK